MKKTTLTLLILSLVFVLLYYSALFSNDKLALLLLIFIPIVGFILVVLILIALFAKKNFIAASIGVIALSIVIFRPIEFMIESLKSPKVASAYCEHTVSAVSIILRMDHSFEYNAGTFLSHENYTGTYSIKGDTVILHFENKYPTPVIESLVYKEHLLKEIGNPQHNHEFILTKNLIWK